MSPKKNWKMVLSVAKYKSNLHCMLHTVFKIHGYCDATHCLTMPSFEASSWTKPPS